MPPPPSSLSSTPSSLKGLTRRQRAAALETRKPRVLIDDFERLLAEFEHHLVQARRLKVTDPKHDALIRTGLQGFSLTSKVFKWSAPHFLYLQRNGKLKYAGLGDGPMLFFCLCAGYALGLGEEDLLLKPEFKAAESHLDSVLRLNLQAIRDAYGRAMTVTR